MDPAVRFRDLQERMRSAYKEMLELIGEHPEVLESQDQGPRWVHGIIEGEEGHEEIKLYRHWVIFQTSYGDVDGCLFVGADLKRDEPVH